MRFSLLPKIMTESLTDLTPQFLKSKGIDLLLLDFDNTIVPYTTDTPTPQMEAWLTGVQEAGVRLCVVSNSHKDRVKHFCRGRDIACITHSRKPFSKGIRQALAQFPEEAGRCALAGDQIFTDVLGANCAGVTSILVKPINNHNFWLKARHVLEQPFIYLARKRRMNP